MKLLLSLLCLTFFMCLQTIVSAQSPQSVCYQGVAAAPNGAELVNQPLGIRFSVLQGSPSGTPVYVETQSTTTDAFGLFNVHIGEGLPTLGTFGAINWGSATHFLKIEMDVTGGSIYQLLGVNQMLSVPYALYADQAGKATTADSAAVAGFATLADSAAVAGFAATAGSALFADSALYVINADTADYAVVADSALVAYDIVGGYDVDSLNEIQEVAFDESTGEISLSGTTGVINIYNGIFRAPGASIDYPLGIKGIPILFGAGENSVPVGQTLFLTGGLEQIEIKSGNNFYPHKRFPALPILKEGTVVKDCYCSGLLIPNSDAVIPVLIDFSDYQNGYMVPAGKSLVLKSGVKTLFVTNSALGLSGSIFYPYENDAYSGNMIFPESTLLQPFGTSNVIMTGYLINFN